MDRVSTDRGYTVRRGGSGRNGGGSGGRFGGSGFGSRDYRTQQGGGGGGSSRQSGGGRQNSGYGGDWHISFLILND